MKGRNRPFSPQDHQPHNYTDAWRRRLEPASICIPGGALATAEAACGKQQHVYIPRLELGVVLGMGGIVPSSSAMLEWDVSVRSCS